MPRFTRLPDGTVQPIPEPVEPSEPEMLEDEGEEQPEDKKGGWEWVGSPDRPEAQKASDGISDLFEVDSDDDTSDLVSVDLEKDIIDGNLDDLTEVSEEDILGDEETGQVPLNYRPDAPRKRVVPRSRRGVVTRYVPPTSTRGVGA